MTDRGRAPNKSYLRTAFLSPKWRWTLASYGKVGNIVARKIQITVYWRGQGVEKGRGTKVLHHKRNQLLKKELAYTSGVLLFDVYRPRVMEHYLYQETTSLLTNKILF